MSYYIMIGGHPVLAQPFLEVGLLHLEGAASVLLSASYSSLSSIRVPFPQSGDAEAWKRDRDIASRYFDRARALHLELDVAVIPDDGTGQAIQSPEAAPTNSRCHRSKFTRLCRRTTLPRRRQKEYTLLDEIKGKEHIDNAWYLNVPSLVGAGMALCDKYGLVHNFGLGGAVVVGPSSLKPAARMIERDTVKARKLKNVLQAGMAKLS
ncbi:hypothetical protein OG21DRAFT_1601707 [Imleria badia]|nr:hypothetical protein OG21DRAFT_1601707 [Imleria badia]